MFNYLLCKQGLMYFPLHQTSDWPDWLNDKDHCKCCFTIITADNIFSKRCLWLTGNDWFRHRTDCWLHIDLTAGIMKWNWIFSENGFNNRWLDGGVFRPQHIVKSLDRGLGQLRQSFLVRIKLSVSRAQPPRTLHQHDSLHGGLRHWTVWKQFGYLVWASPVTSVVDFNWVLQFLQCRLAP